jgi:pSer/pThr/pTyr-binding forkhead associated (FHA) protein
VTLDWALLGLRVLAVGLLYAFLAVVVYVIWRDLRVAARGEAVDASPAGGVQASSWLRVSANADLPLSVGDSFAVTPPATLGREEGNQIVLPDAWVSARHARIDLQDGEWCLTDLDSRNGTRLNDLSIARPTSLQDGDIIGIGRVELRFETSLGQSPESD